MSVNTLSLIPAVLTMSSREIADLVEARHNDVVSTIERLFGKGLLRSSRKTRREATGGRPIDVYDLIERDTHLVVAGYSDEHRAKVVDRWQELEAQAAQPKPVTLPQNYIEALEHLLDAKRSEQAAIEQRDEAVRTKALIGSKREATAMATASAAKREADRLRDQLGCNTRHATVIAVENKLKTKFGKQDWRQLKAWCIRTGAEGKKVHDPRWGEAVAWPAGAWLAVFGVDLVELFGELAA